MSIDWHSHFIPPPLIDALRKRTAYPRIVKTDEGEQLQVSDATRRLSFSAESYSNIADRIKSLDDSGVERQVWSWPAADSLRLEDSVPLTKLLNDSLSEVVRHHSSRFSGLATLPLADFTLSARELNRAHRDLDLVGVVLPSEAFATVESVKAIEPILDVAQKWGSHVFVHPRFTPAPGEPPILPPGIDNPFLRLGGLEVQNRLSAAFFTLALTNAVDAYPDVIFHLANLGGAIPFLAERLERSSQHNRGDKTVFTRLRRVHVDTSSFGPRSIRLAVDILGADRVLLGSDEPVFPYALAQAVQNVVDTPLSDEERSAILNNTIGSTFGPAGRGAHLSGASDSLKTGLTA
jgi:predicted TIM-barrel fold metal-dependent hydrolase